MCTSPVQTENASIKQQPAAIRKRRRRAPTGGAADDCFTCAKRNVKCDRRRPYCSQCLEIGNECSGYKTQLTWGVGVASRGKLRGLSLPIAKAPPVAREPKKSPVTRPRAHSSAPYAPTSWRGQDDVTRGPSPRGPIDIPPPSPYHHFGQQQHHHHHQHQQQQHYSTAPTTTHHGAHGLLHHHHAGSLSTSHATHGPQGSYSSQQAQSPHGYSHHSQQQQQQQQHHHHHHQHTASTPTPPSYPLHSFDYLSMSHPGSASPMPHSSWGSLSYSPGSMVHSPDMAPRYSKFPLHISTDALSTSVDSVGSEVDYLSPLSQSYQREEMPFSHSPTVLYDAYPAPNSSPICHSPPPALVLDHCRAPTSYPGLVFSSGEQSLGIHSPLDPFESHHIGHKLMRDYDPLSEHHHMAALPAYPF